ncbi:hypothetical protein [Streptomyces griseoaurantiacus]|uniref:Uncharacterized protein n=1 Tax=Streptomyces griseoaurantiacus TaxID=68213 RepID=A0A7W2DY38_9ACTN|nr:hypothetical protein [Streptomyces griseoaurantiacus]MBA5225006.1 hypothetical protein [Streptomyces griseoaurantiacus]
MARQPGRLLREQDTVSDLSGPVAPMAGHTGFTSYRKGLVMLGIVAAVLFFISFLINAADFSTNDVFSSTNVMLLGLTALALHVAGIGSTWPRRR